MNLVIISTTESQEFQVVWMEANTPEGSFIIQPNHTPTTFVLSPGKEFVCRYKTGKQETRILKMGGILHVTRKESRLLIC